MFLKINKLLRILRYRRQLDGMAGNVAPVVNTARGEHAVGVLAVFRSRSFTFSALISGAIFCAVPTGAAYGAEARETPMTIDDLGFGDAMNDKLFSSRYQIDTTSALTALSPDSQSSREGIRLSSTMVLENAGASALVSNPGLGSGLGLDNVVGDDFTVESPDIDIRRFSTSIENSSGTLTVGNDWSNFQDFLGGGDSTISGSLGLGLNNGLDGAVTSSQIRWRNKAGLSVALEDDFESEAALDAGEDISLSSGDGSSPSLILSWQGLSDSGLGRYRMSALGRQMQLEKDSNAAQSDEELGWGLNLAGGWQFGDLFAKLSLTLGNSIDSFILGRFSDSKSSTGSVRFEDLRGLNEAFSISPGLDYRLTDNGKLHFSLNRFQSAESDAVAHGVDTLDTVHLGYTWTPWPSTRFGIEFVGKDIEGTTEMTDSSEVNFAASKRF